MSQNNTVDFFSFNDGMIDEKKRLSSFKNWPFKKGICTKDKVSNMYLYFVFFFSLKLSDYYIEPSCIQIVFIAYCWKNDYDGAVWC